MKQRDTYDRIAVGERLRERRKMLGWSKAYAAEKAELTEKYYGDIEGGRCGMSIETLLTFSRLYGFGLDELLLGTEQKRGTSMYFDILDKNLEGLSPAARERCMQGLLIFIQEIRS